MKILLPWFELNGTSSYPDFHWLFENLKEVEVGGTQYYLAEYNGVKDLETGAHKYATDYSEPAPVTGIRNISVGAMRRRFTLSERVAIEESTDSTVKVLAKDLETNEFIGLDHQDTIDGMNYLEAQLLIGAGRAAELLADGDGVSIGETGEL